MFRKFKPSLTILSLGLAATAPVLASVPNLFSYQGRIAGASGNPSANLTVRLWSASTAGTLLFSETQNNVPLTDGIFSILVGNATAGGVPDSVSVNDMWLGLSINGGAELAPRTRLSSVPFAIRAKGAQSLLVPGTSTIAATVENDGHVIVDGKVDIGAATDNGGVITLDNSVDTTTVRIDGSDTSNGGRIELANGATTNVDTVIVDGNDGSDGVMYLYDANNFESVRIHSDRINDAPELAMFTGSTAGQIRETVQLTARQESAGNGAGSLILRRVADPAQSATNTVELNATSFNLLGDPNDGGYLALKYTDGSPVFTVQAGGTSAISPAFMELRSSGGLSDRRLYATPLSLTYFDSTNTPTITMSGSSGTATYTGEVTVGVLTITGGADLSEQFDIRSSDDCIQPGMVVCIDPRNPGELVVSNKPYDRTVAGVVSGAGGVKPGMMMSQQGTLADGKHPVALTGRVWVNCDAAESAIEPGDLLTTSPTPGHAMKSDDALLGAGSTIGKAMTPLAAGERGLVLVLVNLQ